MHFDEKSMFAGEKKGATSLKVNAVISLILVCDQCKQKRGGSEQ